EGVQRRLANQSANAGRGECAMKIDLDLLDETNTTPAADAFSEVQRIRADARALGWSDTRLMDLALFLAPGEYVAMIGGDTMAIGYRAGSRSRYFLRRK